MMHKENILGGVHSHATFLHVLMHVASDRLSVKLAVLVSVSHMCLPLPLRNGTTFNISQEDEIGADEEDNSTTPILNFTLSFEISSVSTILNISTEIADSTLPSTLQYPPDDERSIPYLPYNQYAWLRYFGTKTVFLPVLLPRGDHELILRLMQNVSAVSIRTSKAPRTVQNAYTLPALITAFISLLIAVALTVLIRRGHSLDFVRSPSIRYIRKVDDETKSYLTKAKASLPTLAGMKGVYGRGRMKEISDVFLNMGGIPPPHTADHCFADPTPDKADLQPCTRIKLLTPEEVARDEL